MCGLTGFYLNSVHNLNTNILDKMSSSIEHRGPDYHRTYTMGRIGLAHQRLSILDLSFQGNQPMLSADGKYAIVFNGEIYNFSILRSELKNQGVAFKSRTDTEVILEGYRLWGIEILERLNGMFAVALVDLSNEHLLLARDRFGVKPLYYSLTSSGLVFGSEIKAILLSGIVEKDVNYAAVSEYLHYSGALGDKTFFDKIYRLGPGTALCYNGRNLTSFQFANAIPNEQTEENLQYAASNILDLLDSSVKGQLVADVPVGILLSGGVDSSAIAALASRHTTQRLQTFSADFAFAKDQSELRRAREVAHYIGSEHYELQVKPDNLETILEKLVHMHDQPFGDPANIPIYLICRELQGSPKVVLQGDGGDELFAGYARYTRLARKWLYSTIGAAALPLHHLIPKQSTAFRALRTFHAMCTAPEELRMALIMSQEVYGENPIAMLSSDLRNTIQKHDPFSQYRKMHHRFSHLDPVQAMLYTDVSTILPDIYFEKVDRASMANSIEVRVPMMDNSLAQYALSLPSRIKLSGGKKKILLKKAFNNILPHNVLYGKKHGFSVPISRWLKEPLADYLREVLFDPSVRQSNIFDYDELNRRIEQHISGTADHGKSLYKMLNFAIWWQKYFS